MWTAAQKQLLVSLRNLEKVTVVLSDGTQRDVFAFPDSAAAPLPGTFMPGFSEGNWTPEFYLYTPSLGVQPTFTYDTAFTMGRYYRLGNWVHASARVKLTAKSGGTGTGSIGVKGLPFKVQFASAPFSGTTGFRANFTTGPDQAYAQDVTSIGDNGRDDMVILARTNATSQTLLSSEMQATSDISISVVYRTDAP